jgi:hypothetical protein
MATSRKRGQPPSLALNSRLGSILRIGRKGGEVTIVWPVPASHNRNRCSNVTKGGRSERFFRDVTDESVSLSIEEKYDQVRSLTERL